MGQEDVTVDSSGTVVASVILAGYSAWGQDVVPAVFSDSFTW